MFQALRGPLTVGGRLLLSTIFYCECPQVLAIRLALDLADLFVARLLIMLLVEISQHVQTGSLARRGKILRIRKVKDRIARVAENRARVSGRQD